MVAGVLAEIAGVIAACAVLIAAATGWSVRKTIRTMSADMHGVKVTTEAVNKAVNNVPHGAKSLLDKIDDLHAKQDSFMAETDEWRSSVDERLVRIEDHITRPTPTRRKSA